MTPKMVVNFRRSLSFPNNPSHSSSSKSCKAAYHVRSTSLPCRPNPLISLLRDDIRELRSWGSHPHPRTAAWLCAGLSRLKTVHEYLHDLLQLPQTHDSLRCQSGWVENLLEDFLHFIDAYGTFQTLILALKQENSAVQVAIRRKDKSEVALYAKAMTKLAKEVHKLVPAIRWAGNRGPPVPDVGAELSGVIGDVTEVTWLVSSELFNGVSATFMQQRSSWVGLRLPKRVRVEEGIEEFKNLGMEGLWDLRKKGEEEVKLVLKTMHELEDCISSIECGSERVFRSMMNTRVSLLNVSNM